MSEKSIAMHRMFEEMDPDKSDDFNAAGASSPEEASLYLKGKMEDWPEGLDLPDLERRILRNIGVILGSDSPLSPQVRSRGLTSWADEFEKHGIELT